MITSEIMLGVVGRGTVAGSGVMVDLVSGGVVTGFEAIVSLVSGRVATGSETMVGGVTELYEVATFLTKVDFRFEVLSGSLGY